MHSHTHRTRTNSSQPTAVVNDESVIRLLTSHSLPPSNEILTSNIDHPHTETTSERGTQDQDDSSRQRNGGYDTELQHSGSIPTADSSVKRSKGHSKGLRYTVCIVVSLVTLFHL